jgi:HSP20 family protein
MTLVKFKKNDGNALMPGFNDIFESIFNDTFFSEQVVSRVPAVNVSETENKFLIDMAAPGLKKEDFKISVDRDQLTISVEQKVENQETLKRYNKREFSYNSFVRSFTLPEIADYEKIDANYNEGILRVEIAKQEEAKVVSKQIEIK